jgi:hypothetical protein
MGRDPPEPELLGGLFLLAGEKALQKFGAFLFIALNTKPQKYFTGLRNTPGLLLRHILELLLQISGDAKSEWGVFSHVSAIV